MQECRQQAQLHLKAVLAQQDDPELSQRQQAAREAQARAYQQRVDAALQALEQQRAVAQAPSGDNPPPPSALTQRLSPEQRRWSW